MADVSQILSDAYRLIENDNAARAREELTTIREQAADNPDYWWLYVHATENPEEGREALARVLALDPDYPGAIDLAQAVGLETPEVGEVELAERAGLPMPKPPSLPGPAAGEPADIPPPFEGSPQPSEKQTNNNRLILLGIVSIVVVVLILGALFLLLNSFSGDEVPPTEVAQEPTETFVPTAAPLAVPTEVPTVPTVIDEPESTNVVVDPVEETPADSVVTESVEETPAEDIVSTAIGEATQEPSPATMTPEPLDLQDVPFDEDVSVLFEPFGVEGDGFAFAETNLGTTFVVTTCEPRGPLASVAIENILQTLAAETGIVPDRAEAIGVRIADCVADRTATVVGIPRAVFVDLVEQTVTYETVESSLQPLISTDAATP